MKFAGSVYFRLTIIIVAFFTLVTGTLWVLLSHQVYNHEVETRLSAYDGQLNTLNGMFSEKVFGFPNSLSTIFGSAENLSLLYSALEMQDAPSSRLKTEIAGIIDGCFSSDYNITGIILDSFSTEYYYVRERIGSGIMFLKKNEDTAKSQYPQRELLTSAAASNVFPYCPDGRYAISAILNRRGRIIIFYSDAVINSLMSANNLSSALFTVRDQNGETLYSYGSAPSKGSKTIKEQVANQRYGYTVSYEVDLAKVMKGYQNPYLLLMALILVFSGIIAAAYVFTISAFRKQVRLINYGLERIGSADFTYCISEEKLDAELRPIVTGINSMSAALHRHIDLHYTYMLQQKNAELYALQTSINPHFLSNTLEAIRAEIAVGKQNNAQDMLVLLNQIYRKLIRQKTFVTLIDEIDLCDLFWELYQLRFANFEYIVDVDVSLYAYALPTNTMQPIIENYFEHGLDPKRNDNRITVSVRREGEILRMTVENNGRSISNEELRILQEKLASKNELGKAINTGFGLKNVNDRLRIVYGDEHALSVYVPEGGGFAVSFTFLPLTPDQLAAQYEELVNEEMHQ